MADFSHPTTLRSPEPGDLAAAFKAPDPRPSSEGGIGRAKARGRSRARTHRTQWAELHARKGGQCRLRALGGCDSETGYELHHLLSKARGGPNEAWNLCALCSHHHALVSREDAPTLAALGRALTDEEYAGLVEAAGEGVLERLFGITYDRAIGSAATAGDSGRLV